MLYYLVMIEVIKNNSKTPKGLVVKNDLKIHQEMSLKFVVCKSLSHQVS